MESWKARTAVAIWFDGWQWGFLLGEAHIFHFYPNLYVALQKAFLSGRSFCNSFGWLPHLSIRKDYLGFPDCRPSLSESRPRSLTLVLLSLCGANTHKNAQGADFHQSSPSRPPSSAPAPIWRLDHSCELLVVPASCKGSRSFSRSGNVNWKLKKRLRSKEPFSSKVPLIN